MIELLCDVEPGLVERVTKLACPRDGAVLVVVGTPYLSGKNLAECVPRRALGTAYGSVFRGHAYRTIAWDAGVAIAAKVCPLSYTHPAAFAQIVAHEFGHATVAIRDPDLHTYCTFIDLAIAKASGRRITRYDQLPHERAFDAYGNWVAMEIFGADAFRREMDELIAAERPDRGRLEAVVATPPLSQLDGLRAQVRAFAEPYRDSLERMWAEAECASTAGIPNITQQASQPIGALWM